MSLNSPFHMKTQPYLMRQTQPNKPLYGKSQPIPARNPPPQPHTTPEPHQRRLTDADQLIRSHCYIGLTAACQVKRGEGGVTW